MLGQVMGQFCDGEGQGRYKKTYCNLHIVRLSVLGRILERVLGRVLRQVRGECGAMLGQFCEGKGMEDTKKHIVIPAQ
jgi:hypothetical protein